MTTSLARNIRDAILLLRTSKKVMQFVVVLTLRFQVGDRRALVMFGRQAINGESAKN